MSGKTYFLAVALCASCYAIAATHSIGNVTARGEMRIDNYPVKGSGTVFDGSVLETGQTASSGADVRLGGDSIVSLDIDSRGTIFRDHFLLQRGKVEFGSSTAFRVEARGIVITLSSQQTSGSVSIASEGTVNVNAVAGDLEIRGSNGELIAKVHPGHPLAFNSQNGNLSSEVSASGLLTSESGHYFLKTADTDVKYEVKSADNLQDLAGCEVTASGSLGSDAADDDAAAMILASSVSRFDPSAPSAQTASLISGLSVGRVAPEAVTSRACPKGARPVHCCPHDPRSPMCCPNQLYPARRCHHSE